MKVNAEYHTIGGENIVESNPKYKEYRKKWHEYPKKFYVSNFPLFLDIDITDRCNLKCPFCLRMSNPEVIKNELMPFNSFKRIIDEGVKNNLYGVKLNIIGEPLLHPNAHRFVKYAKENGLIDVYFNSNGTLLSESKINKLIDADLDRISISFEGNTKEVYERYRIGSKFETVVENIKKLKELREKKGVNKPKIRIQTVLLPELVSQIETYNKFWESIVDEVGFLDYQPRVDKKDEILIGDWACPQLWQRMGVLVDGTIIPCNHDEKGLSSLGNIKNISIKNAWHSDKLNNLRKLHKNGEAHKGSSCKLCYLRWSEVKKLKKVINKDDPCNLYR